MSWKGFKKVVDRATTSVMMQTGYIDKTTDKQFDDQEKRFKSYEAKVEKLHTEAKGYLDAVRAMTLSQTRIAETVDGFYEDGTQLGDAAIKYKDIVKSLDEKDRDELDKTFRETVLDPIGKLAATFPEFNETIKKRQKKLLDYDKTRSAVKRLVDKPSDDKSRLPQAEEENQQAKELYDRLNNTLLEEIPKVIDLRVLYLNPCFESLVLSQLEFNKQAFLKFDGLKRHFQTDDSNIGLIEDQIENVLGQMRELSICSH